MKILRLTMPFTGRFAVAMVWAQCAAVCTCMLLFTATLLKTIWGVAPADTRGPDNLYVATGEQWFFFEIERAHISNTSVPDSVVANFLEGYVAYHFHPGVLLALIYIGSGIWYAGVGALAILDPATWVIWLRLGRNPLRWLYHATVGPVAVVLTAISAGIGSAFELGLLGVITAASSLFLLCIDVAVFADSNVNRAYPSAASLNALSEDIEASHKPRLPVWIDKGNEVAFHLAFLSATGLQGVVWTRVVFEVLYFQVQTKDTTIPDAIWALIVVQVFAATLQLVTVYLAYTSVNIIRPFTEAPLLVADVLAKCCMGGLALQWGVGIHHVHTEQ